MKNIKMCLNFMFQVNLIVCSALNGKNLKTHKDSIHRVFNKMSWFDLGQNFKNFKLFLNNSHKEH